MINIPRTNCGRNDCSFKLEYQSNTLIPNSGIDTLVLNTVNGRMGCVSCSKQWLFTQTYQGTEFVEIKTKAANQDELE